MTALPSYSAAPRQSPLVAVLLVVTTSSRSPQLVFRYPRKPRVSKRYSKVQYYSSGGKEASQADSQSGQASSSRRASRQTSTYGLDQATEQARDRAQWDEEQEDQDIEEDSDSSHDSSSSGLTSDNEPFGDSGSETGGVSTTDVASGEDSDQETTASDAMSQSQRTDVSGSHAKRGSDRRSRLDRDAPGRLTSARAQASIGSGPESSRMRSRSRPRMTSSSLRDPTIDSSPERQAHTGEHVNGSRHQKDPASRRRGSNGEHSASRRAKNAKAFSHYLGYPVDFLAEMLAPKKELCNRRFELVVDDLAFIGHPVAQMTNSQHPANRPSDTQRKDQDRGRRGRKSEGSASEDDERDVKKTFQPVTMFHLVFVLQPPDPSWDAPTLDLTTWLGFWYDNVVFKLTAGLWAEEQRCSYVSTEADAMMKLWAEVEGNTAIEPSFALHLSRILVMSSLSKTIKQAYRLLMSASAYRTSFVSLNDNLDVHLQLPPLLVDPAKMVKSIMELGPSIEAEDADMWADRAAGEGSSALDEWTRATGPPLLPWKSLLLLHDTEESARRGRRFRSFGGKIVAVESDEDEDPLESAYAMEEELGAMGMADAGIQMWARKFTALLRPTLQGVPTFADLASLLSWDLHEDVYPMARHLVYYKQARVTDVPRIQNTYALSPLLELSSLPLLADAFAVRFSEGPPLAKLLAAIGSSFLPFITHYHAVTAEMHRGESQNFKRRAALDCLVWLLRHEVILQQHLRFRLVATEEVKRRARQLWQEQRFRREETRRRQQERREWRRERRALKRGSSAQARRGDLVPLVPQSAPNEDDRLQDLAAFKSDDRGRPRQRSRSAEARERALKAGEGDPVASSGAASRVSASSRSRSRNPLPLGRVTPFGRLSTATSPVASPASHDRPTARVPEQTQRTSLEFQRLPVLRSRSPSRTQTTAPSPIVTAKSPEPGDNPAATRIDIRQPPQGSSSSGQGAPGSSFTGTPSRRERAFSILAEQQRQRGTSMARDGTQRSTGSTSSSGVAVTAQAGVVAGTSFSPHGIKGSRGRPDRALLTIERQGTRSPSQARLRVRGFGQEEEVWIDGHQITDDAGAPSVGVSVPLRPSASDTNRAAMSSSSGRGANDFGVARDVPHRSRPGSLFDSDDGSGLGSDLESEAEEEEATYEDDLEAEPSADFTPSLISDPSRATGEENSWIAAMVSGKDTVVSQRFFRLLPYLDGRHTIDEVVCREEMRRRELRLLLAEFREEILTFAHP